MRQLCGRNDPQILFQLGTDVPSRLFFIFVFQ